MVGKIRIIWNIALAGALCAGLLGLIGTAIFSNLDALCLGILGGIIYGSFYWRHLSHRISRQHRRFERNRVLVRFLSPFEFLLAAITWNIALFPALILLLIVAFLLDARSGHWWGTLIAGGGIAAAAILGGQIIRYERRHGSLYYQYDSRAWLGGEGLLYQRGTVIEPLTPKGRIKIQGEGWNAVALGNENVEAGREVEVVARTGLTLYVEALPPK